MSNGREVAILLDHFGGGGVERVACHIANGLQKRGFQVELVVVRDSGPVRELLDSGVGVRVLPVPAAWRRLPRGARLLAAAPALARYLREHRPAVFHSPGNHTHLAAGLAVRLARYDGVFVPKITNPIIKQGMPAWQRGLRRWVYTHLFKSAARVIVLSELAVARAGMIHAELAARAIFIPNPYVSDAMAARVKVPTTSGTPLVLSVGRLSRQKDYPTLLRALALLQGRQWRLRICGTGRDRDDLLALAGELGIADRVELPGFLADVVPQYSEATVMVLSSRWEDLPATLVEAMACGCPVVSTASSPAVEQLLEATGARLPAPVGDPAALSCAILEALDGRLPAVRREALMAYGIEAACDAHAQLFSDLL